MWTESLFRGMLRLVVAQGGLDAGGVGWGRGL